MPFKVLVAESSPSAVRAVEYALPPPEFSVRSFGDGLDAIEAAGEALPDAILAAFSLPERDGYDLGAFVRAQPGGGQVAILFLRGSFEPLDMAKLSPLAHDGIVQKPFDGETLAALVREAIGRKHELPFLPEEPAIDRPAEAGPPPGKGVGPGEEAAPGTGDLEARIRAAVRAEILELRPGLDKAAAAEARRILVEELKKTDAHKG